MKNLRGLKGAKFLNKKEQQLIRGGSKQCDTSRDCPRGTFCYHGKCYRD